MDDDPPPDRRARFDALWRAHYADVVGYARRRRPGAARDVAAETFLVVWRRLDDVPLDDPLPWLIGVARRALANHVRSERRRSALLVRLGGLAREVGPDPADMQGDERIRAAFARLRPAEREVIALVLWEGLDASRLGAALGCSPRAAAVRLHRARGRLRAALAEAGVDPPEEATAASPAARGES